MIHTIETHTLINLKLHTKDLDIVSVPTVLLRQYKQLICVTFLPQLYKGRKKPEFIVEDCDAWFMEDLERLVSDSAPLEHHYHNPGRSPQKVSTL